MLTTVYLMERYGPLLTEAEVGEVLNIEPGTVRNQRVRGSLGVQGFKQGGSWMFHAQDVGQYVDGLRKLVRAA